MREGATMMWQPTPTVDATVCDYCHDVVVAKHTRVTIRGFVICAACLLLRYVRGLTKDLGSGEVPNT